MLPPITVTNGTQISFRIRVYPALVDQSLDGSLIIRKRTPSLTGAPSGFVLRPRRVVLDPGTSASVRVLFLRAAPGLGGAQAAAVIEAVPPPTRGRGPSYRLRLLAALLVRTPDAPAARGRISAVRAVKVGRRRLGLCTRVRNTGRVHGYARDLLVRVRSAQGRTVLAASLRSGVVLSGFQRDFCVDVPRRLRTGRYRVEARGRFGDQPTRMVSAFTLQKGGRLVAPATG